jgi:signal transduction histidine kinase
MNPTAELLLAYLGDLLYCPNKACLDVNSLPDDFRDLGLGLRVLQGSLKELRDFTAALGQGNLAVEPPRNNELASPMKKLHANLRHLTWQAQRVAMGDYSQKVQFMGEFADSFNSMTRQLGERHRFLLQEVDNSRMKALKLEQVTNSVTNPLTIIAMNRHIMYMNEAGLNIFNKTLKEVVGTPYDDYSIYPSGTKYDPIAALEEGRDAEILYAETIKRYIKGVASYLYGKNGEPIGFIIVSSDVTNMVKKQIELQDAMDEARAANAHKGDFLARMSHEIRTPMNSIIGLSNLVQHNLEKFNSDDDDLVEIKSHVRQIESSSQHLLGLLNDILDLSKIESGKLVLSEETTDLGALADMVGSIIKPRCDEKSITFKTKLDSLPPVAFKADALRLRQVLINLLGNAVKFTPEGGSIDFSIIKKDRRDGCTLLQFIVRDTGIGISREAMKTVFSPFEQAHGQISREYGGTGLGLSISRRIVNMLGGEITLNSEEGQGSEFSFSIWLTESDEALTSEKAAFDPIGRFDGKKVLLVDDVDLNRKVVRAMLKNTGAMVDEAEDGVEALTKFQATPEGYYGIILMDIQMPKMDGYQASKAIRQLSRADAKSVPIIALTANAFHDDIKKALCAGMNAHQAKPIKRNQLVDTLEAYLG